MNSQPVLSFKNIEKSFGENLVLTGLNFDVHPGEIVALVGENGSGKSTLMNILFGMDVIRETGGFKGSVQIDGREAQITSPLEAIEHGIGMVHQEFMLIPGFTVQQNIKLNREPLQRNLFSRLIGKSFDTIDIKTMRRDAEKALKRVHINASPEDHVALLPVGIKQFVEISREIDKENLKLLVLDEPSAVLTETEAGQLLEAMRSFSDEGIAIIFITHRLDEVFAVSDRVVILRDGLLVADEPAEKLTKTQIAEMMVGRPLAETFTSSLNRNISDEDIIFEFRDVSVNMPGEELSHLNLRVRRGEILGIGGLAGHGKLAVGNAVAGMYPYTGDMNFDGSLMNLNKTGEALKHDIAFVSEDRKGVGLLLDESVIVNITFTDMIQKNHYLKKFGAITQFDYKKARQDAERMIEELEIRCQSPEDPVGRLSGGNQQKVCIAGVLIANPRMLFVSEPTRGIDIGAKKLILNRLQKINYESGVTIVMVSSELVELRSICDRIAIISGGELQGILQPDAANADFALMMSGDPSVRQKGGVA